MKSTLAIAIAILSFGFASASGFGQPPPASTPTNQADSFYRAPHRRIAGLWDESVTILNCATGAAIATLQSTNLFSRDGSLVATNSAPPASMSPALGMWWHESGDTYFGAKMRLARFNPDGSFAGIREIQRSITLGNNADSLTGVVNTRDFDPSGNATATICATEKGTRVSIP